MIALSRVEQLAEQMNASSVPSPKHFKAAIGTCFQEIQDSGQHDAHELCRLLLHRLDAEMNALHALEQDLQLDM